MPPKKIKVNEEQIEYMNVPLKSGFRYATEEEALKNNKILLWGKHKVSLDKLEEYKKYLSPPKRRTRAKEFRPDFLLAGEVIERRENIEKDEKEEPVKKIKIPARVPGGTPLGTARAINIVDNSPKSKLKDYEKRYISTHKYTIDDIKLLKKLYDDIGRLQDEAEETDEELYNKLLDDESSLSDLIDKIEAEIEDNKWKEDLVRKNPNHARIEKLKKEIEVINKEIKEMTPSPNSKANITSLTAKKNQLFDEISKLSKMSGRAISSEKIKRDALAVPSGGPLSGHRKGALAVPSGGPLSGISGGVLFQKTHGKSSPIQPYFYWYFDKMPTHVVRTKWRPATAEEAINNDMVALYGVNSISENLEKKAKLVGHSGEFHGLNDTQLELMKAKFMGKRNKIKKSVGDLILKLEHTHDEEEKDILLKKLEEYNEIDEELYKILYDIIHKIANVRGKEVKELKPRDIFKFEEKKDESPEIDEHPKFTIGKETEHHEKLRRNSPGQEYRPREPKETPKSDNKLNVIETDFKPMKIQHIFENEDEKIYLDTKYFKDNKLIDKYAKKLATRNYFFNEKYYSEKMCKKLLFHDTGESRMTGGKLSSNKFFNQIGTSMKGAVHTIDNGIKSSIETVKTGLQSGINYVDKVIHGSDEYLPHVKTIINKYGQQSITGLTIGRAPVPGAITGALNAVSGGTFKEGMNSQPYDKLFHLFLYLTLNDGTKILFEKNATLNSAVNPPLPPNTETLLITIPNNTTTLTTFLQNGQNKMGNKYFVYDPHYNNCQDYIIGLLSGNGWGTQQDYKWIKQDTGQLFANNKYLGTVAKSVTNFGGVVDRVIKGVGFKKDNHIQSILFKRPEWTEDKALKWLDEHEFKDDVDIKKNYLRYRQVEPNDEKYNYKTKKIGDNIEFVLGYQK